MNHVRFAFFTLCVALSFAAPVHAATDLLRYLTATVKSGAAVPEKGTYAIELNTALRGMGESDVAQLALPDGRSYDVVYDHSFAHPNGDTTWVGHLATAGKDYRVMITLGRTSTTGRILTPSGEYALTGTAGSTWLVDHAAAGVRTFIGEVNDTRGVPSFGPREPGQSSAETKAATTTQIDVLVLYSTVFAAAQGGDAGALTRINNLLAIANQSYLDSQVAIELRLVGTQKVDYADSTPIAATLSDLTGYNESGPLPRPAALAQVPTWRNNAGADLVSLVRTLNGDNPDSDAQKGLCGLAWVGGQGMNAISQSAEFAFSVVDDGRIGTKRCSDFTFVHELGHNMGSMHDRGQVMSGNNGQIEYGAYSYSFGYGMSGAYTTIMGYPSSFNNAARVGRFSNPDIDCSGSPCGVSETDVASSANNALSLNNTRVAVSNFRSPAGPPAPNSVIVEFYNTTLNHYFITASDAEKRSVDSGGAGPGWQRTGLSFKVGGAGPVCRFYGNRNINPATGQPYGPNSHFYTIEAAECAAVKLDPGWTFESSEVFDLTPVSGPGSCPTGTLKVYRAYNNRAAQNDSNHRYTTDLNIYNQRVAQNWIGEGVVFCAPQ